MKLASMMGMLACLALPATAEVYKCGNTYSQTPCGQGSETVTIKRSGPAAPAPGNVGLRESEKALLADTEKRQQEAARAACRRDLAAAETQIGLARSERARLMEQNTAVIAANRRTSKDWMREDLQRSAELDAAEQALILRAAELRARPECQ